MRDPAAGAVVFPRSLRARRLHRFHESKQWLVQVREVTHLGRPVVHLDIYVEVPVRVPWILNILSPQSLEVGGKSARSRAGNQQVSSEVKIQLRETRIGFSSGKGFQPCVSRFGRGSAALRTKLQAGSIEVAVIVSDMRALQSEIRLRGGAGEILIGCSDDVARFSSREALDVGGSADENEDAIGIANPDLVLACIRTTAGIENTHSRGETYSLTINSIVEPA